MTQPITPPFATFARRSAGVYDPEGNYSVHEALTLTGLGFDAVLVDATGYDEENGCYVSIPNSRSVLRREPDGSASGIATVGRRYSLVQHRDAFAFAQNLVDDFDANVVAAAEHGPFPGTGARAFVVLRLPRTINVNDLDVYDVYVMVSNSHDGSSGVVGTVVPVHKGTGATIEAAITGIPQRFVLRHSGDMEGKLKEAEDTMRKVEQWSEAYEEAAGALLGRRLTPDEADTFLNHLFPTSPLATKATTEARAETRALVKAIWDGLPDQGYGRRSCYGAFLAVCTYVDFHASTARSADPELTRAERTINGEAAKIKQKAWKLLAALHG